MRRLSLSGIALLSALSVLTSPARLSAQILPQCVAARFPPEAPLLVHQSGGYVCVSTSVAPQPVAEVAQRFEHMLAFEFKLTPVFLQDPVFVLLGAQAEAQAPRTASQYLRAERMVLLPDPAEGRLLLHELTHCALDRLQPAVQRALWLEEGLAEWLSDAASAGQAPAQFTEWPRRFAAERDAWRSAEPSRESLRFTELLDASAPTRDHWLREEPERAQQFMAQAFALVQFLRRVREDGSLRGTPDSVLLRRLLRSDTRGREALLRVLGPDWTLERAATVFRDWLRHCALLPLAHAGPRTAWHEVMA